MEWILNNLIALLGAGGLSGVVGWFVGGKQAKAQELKKGETEINKGNADAVSAMQEVYNKFLDDYKIRMSEVMNELTEVKDNYKTMQKQFNEMQISYSKDTEKHRDLSLKYIALQKDHESLKSLYDKLKKDFEQQKKLAK